MITIIKALVDQSTNIIVDMDSYKIWNIPTGDCNYKMIITRFSLLIDGKKASVVFIIEGDKKERKGVFDKSVRKLVAAVAAETRDTIATTQIHKTLLDR